MFLTLSITANNVLFAQTSTPPSSVTTINPNQGQGQKILPQQPTSPKQTQLTQEPIIKPFTIPKNNPTKNTGTTNSGITVPNNSNGKQITNDIALLGQRYISEQFGDRIVGEVLNNGSGAAEFVQITVSFYDGNEIFLDSEFTYADPSIIEPGNRAPFNVIITNETIKDNSEKYEFTLQWMISMVMINLLE